VLRAVHYRVPFSATSMIEESISHSTGARSSV
jgi:hypothetical protein